MESFDDYQNFAELYIKHTESSSHNAYYERPAMFSILENLNFKRVLDAGCAGGIYAEWFINRKVELVAIDIKLNYVCFQSWNDLFIFILTQRACTHVGDEREPVNTS